MAVSFPLIWFIMLTKLSDIVFNSKDIGKVLSGLDPNKAHWHMKTCDESIQKMLDYIIRASLHDEQFPSEWKKGQCSANHKKRW